MSRFSSWENEIIWLVSLPGQFWRLESGVTVQNYSIFHWCLNRHRWVFIILSYMQFVRHHSRFNWTRMLYCWQDHFIFIPKVHRSCRPGPQIWSMIAVSTQKLRFVLGGLSAGGHLAAMTALERGPELGLAGKIWWLLVVFFRYPSRSTERDLFVA